jgi:hypothetical protein
MPQTEGDVVTRRSGSGTGVALAGSVQVHSAPFPLRLLQRFPCNGASWMSDRLSARPVMDPPLPSSWDHLRRRSSDVADRVEHVRITQQDRREMRRPPGRVWVIVDLRSTMSPGSGSRRNSVNCFECAKVKDEVAAVGVCRHCGVGLCFDHLIEAGEFRVGGTTYGCSHELPRVRPLVGLPRGIAASARHHTAGVA